MAKKKSKPLPPIPNEVQEQMAQDKVLLLNEGQLGAPEININEVVDPITQAIRDEIITKQQLYLQQHMAENIADPQAKEDFLKQDLQEVRAYLATDEGKDAMKEVMNDPKFQQEMSTIESTGYSAVHAQFDSFKDVEWGKATAAKVRTTEVTDSNGDPVCSLKETTIDAEPTLVTLEDGTTRTVKSFRKIDFPVELENGNGPMHVSMAAKDENGRNVPEKDAVYFTAHYDDNGKLTEVSSPVPVKFMGEGLDAIAYIERNGKAFTLPITQGKYKQMMLEIGNNKGMNVDLSQEIPPPQAPELQQAAELNVNPNQPNLQRATQHVIPEQGIVASKAKKVTPAAPTKPKVLDVRVQPERHQISEGVIAQSAERVDLENPQLAKEIAVTRKTLEPLKAAEPQFVGNVNLITGKQVEPQVLKRAHEVRVNVGGKPPPFNQGAKKKENALEMINGKSSKKVASIIDNALKKGKAELVADIIGLIDKPPKDAKIPNVGRVLLNKIYIEGMEAASKLGPNSKQQAARMERACGAIAPRAGITDHARRIKASKAEKGPVKG